MLGLYLTLTAAGVLDASFLCGLAVLYGTLLPTTCFSYDEAVHWERYAAATPSGRRGTVDGKYLLALLLACAIKIGGYYLAEAVIYQNWVVPLTSIPGNLIQVGAAAIITLVVIEPLRLAACHTILRK